MTETIMQCCYTNAVKEAGGKISSGWQAVVVSKDLPSEAYHACVNLQNANSTIQSHVVDERGNVLNLFEIAGDGSYAYVSRTQYGLTDRLGRPNMFSHAYIFSWKQEDVLSDPNVFLTLEKENFAQSEEAAKQPLEALKRAEPFTLERAMACTGMTAESYLALIRCVYTQYSERKAPKPLYVQYDGTEEQLRAVLYCVYAGIPYCMRRNLSVASAAINTSKSYNLIFSIDAARHGSYIVPQTGENNVLTPRAERRIARCGFVEYAAARCAQPGEMEEYFHELERLAQELGDPSASDELILRIAHQLIKATPLSELTGPELEGRLSDALRSKSFGSQRMEEYTSQMLEEVCRRKMSLTEEIEANLSQRLNAPATQRLANAGEQYHIYQLSTRPMEDAARRLRQLPAPVFQRYSYTLEQDDKGTQILDHFYAAYGLEVEEPAWEDLNTLLDRTEHLRDCPETTDAVVTAAQALYGKQVKDPNEALNAYHSLMGLLKRLVPEEEELRKCDEYAKRTFWEAMDIQSFDYDRLELYQAMSIECPQRRQYSDLWIVLNAYQNRDEDSFLRKLNMFCSAAENSTVTGVTNGSAFQAKLWEELRRISPEADRLGGWVVIALRPSAQPVMEDVLKLRGQVLGREFKTLAETYQKLKKDLSLCSGGKRLENELASTVVEECRRLDQPEQMVPFDIWLILGRSRYSSDAFHIFDEVNPCCVGTEKGREISSSKLLAEPDYREQAEDYIQSKGAASKQVGKMLSALKAEERRQRAEENRARKEADREAGGSALDPVKGFFSALGDKIKMPGGKRLSDAKREDREEPPVFPADGWKGGERAEKEKRESGKKKSADR